MAFVQHANGSASVRETGIISCPREECVCYLEEDVGGGEVAVADALGVGIGHALREAPQRRRHAAPPPRRPRLRKRSPLKRRPQAPAVTKLLHSTVQLSAHCSTFHSIPRWQPAYTQGAASCATNHTQHTQQSKHAQHVQPRERAHCAQQAQQAPQHEESAAKR